MFKKIVNKIDETVMTNVLLVTYFLGMLTVVIGLTI